MAARMFLLSWTCLGLLLSHVTRTANAYGDSTSDSYYSSTCPRATSIVREKVNDIVKRDKNIAGGLLRLHFHDCFVRGCDASILLSSGERDAKANSGSLRGYDQIDEIKSALETECPGIVSCADIVALAARDATIKVGGPSWWVSLGRKDGFVSSADEADSEIPSPVSTFDELVASFASKGLSREEMVVLSGAHTIGRATCLAVKPRLYDFNGVSGATDPSIDSTFAEELKKKCPQNGDGSILSMDPTKNSFDHLYFKAVLANKGLFTSDAQLLTSAVGQELANRYSQPGSSFSYDFAAAMVKMSNIQWNSQGEVRRTCSAVNN